MQSHLLDVPPSEPIEFAPETFLIPHVVPGPDGVFVPMNSMVIRGEQPVIVDTGTPLHAETWREKVFSLVDPADVRWVFLSHDDGDHTGSLEYVMRTCPNATLISNFFIVERLSVEKDLPIHRMRWMHEGDSLDAGDRTLHLFKPPIFDGPTTRGLFDSSTEVMWIVDSFASMIPHPDALLNSSLVPAELYDDTTALFSSLVSPWHQWLDPGAYGSHVDSVAAMKPQATASAHGPIHTGAAITEGFLRAKAMAGQPIIPGPGQDVLDEIIAGMLAEPV